MPSRKPPPQRLLIGPIFMMLACAFLWLSQTTFDAGDWPSANKYPHNVPTVNACGPVGAFIAYHLRRVIGDGTYLLALFGTCGAFLWLVRGRIVKLWQRLLGSALLVVCTAASLHLVTSAGSNTVAFGRGGLVGAALGGFLVDTFSNLGSALVLGYCFLVGLLFTAEGWVLRLPTLFKRITRRSSDAMALATSQAQALLPAPATGVVSTTIVYGEAAAARIETAPNPESEKVVQSDDPRPDKLPTVGPPAAAFTRKLTKWKLPPLALLDAPEHKFSAARESMLRAKAKTLEGALKEFRLEARVVEIDTGPVITMFELELAPGIKVSRVAALANDIARALKAPGVRIVAPIPGKSTIGVEVPNVDKEKVSLKGIILAAEERIKEMAIPLCLGRDASGKALIVDLAAMPHLLIAGTTGSGKSVSINAIIMSILMCRRPDIVKLVLIDPKMVELSHFKDVPHLMAPIITDTQRAERVLDWAVAKMEERYAIFAEAHVRNITAYNRLGADEVYKRFQPSTAAEKQQIPTHLPYVVIIVDELADLMMTSAKEVEHHLSRLAQKSRAVGIHIIVATQRPEARVVTGLIKSNLPCRCAFRVASRMDSRIVLDQNGAEVLMGQGDMLFLPPGSHKLVRAQGTFVEDHELQNVIGFLTSRGQPEFHPELIRATGKTAYAGERDPLFDDAVRIVLETKRGSVSLLQRRLTIGYSRASRLIDQMADGGIVGDYKGSHAREVIITPEQWAAIRKDIAADTETNSQAAATPVSGAGATIYPPIGASESGSDERTDASRSNSGVA